MKNLITPIVGLSEFLRIVGEVFPKQDVADGEAQYEECLKQREIWDDLGNINQRHVEQILIPFLNKWKCRLPYQCAQRLTSVMQETEQWLPNLRGLHIEDVDFLAPIKVGSEAMRVFALVEKIFAPIQLVKAGRRTVGFTATSKILHMAIPELFVMCDKRIREKYGCEGNAAGYANFMLRMNLLASDLISQAHGNKQSILDCSQWKGRTLARLLDNYNYTTYTLRKA